MKTISARRNRCAKAGQMLVPVREVLQGRWMNNKRIILITGGARSGKSTFALKNASSVPGKKAYIATAEALDEEMAERIELHKKQRGKEWDTYEEPVRIADLIREAGDRYCGIVLDCLTLWLSNIMIRTQDREHGIQATETEIKKFLDALNRFRDSSVRSPVGTCSLFLVSNEVGMGIVPENEMARKFRDLAGILNRTIAETADEVYMVVAGIPLKIKGER